MKHFYTVLAAALMASAVATAQPTPSKGMRFNYDKKQVAAKKSGYLPMLQFGNQTATGKSVVTASPRKVQAYAEKTSTIAPLITEQPNGTLYNNFYRSGNSFIVLYGSVADLPFDGVRGTVVVSDDNKTVYFNDPLGAYYSTSWIKGERGEGDTIEVKLPQQFVHEEFEDGPQDGYLFKLKPTKMTEGGQTYTTFIPTDDQTIKFVWRNDSIFMVNTTDDSKLLGMCDEEGQWYGYGDYVSLYEKFDKQPVAPKDASKAETMSLLYTESGQLYGRVKKVVREGNDFYVAGLNDAMPDTWAKGTLEGDKVTFEGHQYMGFDTLTLAYTFFEPIGHQPTWYDYGDGTGDYYDEPIFLDKIVFDYDAATGSFKSDSTFYVNQGYKKPNQLYTYDEPAFAPWTEKAATPMEVGEENVSYYPYNDMDGYGILTFIPSEFDADGNLLDTKQLYYTVYLDDEPLAFDTQDYPSLKEETTEIPYLFNDQENIVYYAGALNVKTFVEGIDSIGVQLIYKGGGEVRKSAVSYVSAKDEEDTDGIDNIGANASKFVSTVFTDLSGRKVARPAKGVYIQTVRRADGTVKSVKRVFK